MCVALSSILAAASSSAVVAGRPVRWARNDQTRASCAEAAAILLAQASGCLDLAAKSREFWVAASLIDLARELQNRAHRDR
jgi:hypothetical protein